MAPYKISCILNDCAIKIILLVFLINGGILEI